MEAFSIEDAGQGICFNVYCYNVQPGIDLNYSNGDSYLSDLTIEAESILPFVVDNASESNPDLILEMNKHLQILFEGQKDSYTYIFMMNEISTIATEAREVVKNEDNTAQCYIALKEYQYEYFEVLTTYIPMLL